MRVVFLDFDGVLNSCALVERSATPHAPGLSLLDEDAVARLERLCAVGGATTVGGSNASAISYKRQLVDSQGRSFALPTRLRLPSLLIRRPSHEIARSMTTREDACGAGKTKPIASC